MPITSTRAADPLRGLCRVAAGLVALGALLCACGGGGGGGSGNPAPAAAPQDEPWQVQRVAAVATVGLTRVWLDAVPDGDGAVHLFYFEAAGAAGVHRLVHRRWDPTTEGEVGPVETVVEVDNSAGLGAALGVDGQLAVAYQGGVQRTCGVPQQSDLMLAVTSGGVWQEHTAAIGDNPRNPVFQDGFAGADVALAADSAGGFHALYQFYYEGCDAMNFRYPDLRYVHVARAPGGELEFGVEEVVEGNDYRDNVQGRAGDAVALTVAASSAPVAFYAAETAAGTRGLRVAQRGPDGWELDWVETDCVVTAVRATAGPDTGDGPAVVYLVERFTDGRDGDHLVRWARRGVQADRAWQTETVDDGVRCGGSLGVAVDAGGQVAVAYRAVQTYTGYPLGKLRLARRGNSGWRREVLAGPGDLGHFNTLWFDADGRPLVATYAASDDAVYLLRGPPSAAVPAP